MHKGWSKRLLAVLLSLSMVCGSSIIPATTTYALEIAYEGEEQLETEEINSDDGMESSVNDEEEPKEQDNQSDETMTEE